MRHEDLRLIETGLMNEYCRARGLNIDDGQFGGEVVLFHSWKPGFKEISAEDAVTVRELQQLSRDAWTPKHADFDASLQASAWAEGDDEVSVEALADRARNDFIALQNRYELMTVLERVAARKPKVVVEIGTAAGGMFYCFAQVSDPTATLVSIDLPGGPFGGGNSQRESEMFGAFAGPGQQCHFIRDRSFHYSTRTDLERILDGRKIDFLFVDGDHSYGGMIADFHVYSPLMAEGGLIGMHDIVLEPEAFGRGADGSLAWAHLKQGRTTEEIFDPNGSRNPPKNGRPKDYDEMASIAWGIGLIHV